MFLFLRNIKGLYRELYFITEMKILTYAANNRYLLGGLFINNLIDKIKLVEVVDASTIWKI